MSETAVSSLMTAGGLIVTVLLPVVMWMWQEVKDWESGVAVTALAVAVFFLLDPLVLNLFPLIAPNKVDQHTCDIIQNWYKALGHVFAFLPVVPGYRLFRVNSWDMAIISRLYGWSWYLRGKDELHFLPDLVALRDNAFVVTVAKLTTLALAIIAYWKLSHLQVPPACPPV